jgi:hypothetical protein
MLGCFKPCLASYSQALDNASILKMLLNDFVDVFLIHVCVPDIFRVNDNDRAFVATVEAACIVDAYSLALAVKSKRFNAAFCIIAHGLRALVVAADCPIFTLIDTEKHMPLIVAHGIYQVVGWVKIIPERIRLFPWRAALSRATYKLFLDLIQFPVTYSLFFSTWPSLNELEAQCRQKKAACIAKDSRWRASPSGLWPGLE